jgi:hypothetical protein
MMEVVICTKADSQWQNHFRVRWAVFIRESRNAEIMPFTVSKAESPSQLHLMASRSGHQATISRCTDFLTKIDIYTFIYLFIVLF